MITYMCEKTYVSSLVGSKNQSFPIQLLFGADTPLHQSQYSMWWNNVKLKHIVQSSIRSRHIKLGVPPKCIISYSLLGKYLIGNYIKLESE